MAKQTEISDVERSWSREFTLTSQMERIIAWEMSSNGMMASLGPAQPLGWPKILMINIPNCPETWLSDCLNIRYWAGLDRERGGLTDSYEGVHCNHCSIDLNTSSISLAWAPSVISYRSPVQHQRDKVRPASEGGKRRLCWVLLTSILLGK